MRVYVLTVMVLLLGATPFAAAQAPTMYGAPQVAYEAPYGTTLTPNLPNGGQQVGVDTLYLIQAAMRGEDSTFATPAGWSDFCSLTVDPLEHEQLFWQVFPAGSTPPASVTLTTNGTTWGGVIVVAYQGINSATPFDGGDCQTGEAVGTAEQNVPNSNPQSVTAPSFTTSVANDTVFWAFFASNDTGPSGVTVSQGTVEAEVTRQETDAYGYLNWTDLAQASPGGTGMDTAAWTPTGFGVEGTGVIVAALAPAGSSPAEPPPMTISSVAPNVGDMTAPVAATPGHAEITGLNEVVSPENGSVGFTFDLPLPAGRQLNPSFNISYNSGVARFIASTSASEAAYSTEYGLLENDGWSYGAPILTFGQNITSPDGVAQCATSSGYVYQAADGSRIPFNLSLTGWTYRRQANMNDTCDSHITEVATDQEGAWQASANPIVGTWWQIEPVTVTDPDGTKVLFSGDSGAATALVAKSITDRNGNTLGYALSPSNALTITDTLGRTAAATSGFATNDDQITVAGSSSPYTVGWSDETASATANVTGAGATPCTSTTVEMGGGRAVSDITTPQGYYLFFYDAVYGAVNKIVYPNGGYVRYVWEMNPQSEAAELSQPQGTGFATCTAIVDSLALADRYVSPDGKTETEHQHFAYATNWDASNPLVWDSKVTTVTTSDLVAGTSFTTTYTNTSGSLAAPSNALTYVGLQLPLAETVAVTDTGGHTLKTVTQSWQSSYPFQLADAVTNLNGVNVSETGFGYDSLARLTQQDDFGFPGRVRALLRETDTAYASFGDGVNIFDKPASVIVRDGGGNWAAETDYDYDETEATPTSGVEQHVNFAYVPRGNLTSLHRLLKSDGSSALVTTYTVDDTGQILAATDAAGHTTRYGYADSFVSGGAAEPTNAYLTQVTDALGNATSYAWNYGGGTMASSTDPNGQTTQYAFDTSDRLDQVTYPDGGQTTYAYTASTIETKRKIDAQGDLQDQVETFDGLNRASVTATETSAGNWSRVDTCYNGLGLADFTSYPYASSSSSGAANCSAAGDTTAFDSLGRPTQVTHADGSSALSSYSGAAAEVADEGNGSGRVTRVAQRDGLGRTVSVCEVTSQTDAAGNQPADCGQDLDATGFLTTYGFDPLGDTISVTQGAESRSFAYDPVARVTAATNPETGTWSYLWDSDSADCAAPNSSPGDLIARRDARGVVTCYQYDGDHELTGKNYSDGTPAVTLAYGGTSQIGISNLANTAGRLSAASTADHTGTAFSYDPMGRTAVEYEATPDTWSAPATFNFASGYDLAGDLTAFSYSKGDTDSATFNLAGQPLSLASGANGTLISAVAYNGAGEESAATLGNGLAETRGYDARYRPTSITQGGYSFAVASYAPDSAVLQTTDSVNGDFSYTMDALNRLATAACTAAPCAGDSAAYSFDRYGNRWSETGTLPGAAPPALTFHNVHNQADGYSYDANGNLLGDGTHTYSYDAENRLISVDGGSTATYVYNAAGERVHESVGGAVREFLNAPGPQSLTIVDANQNAIETDYSFGGRSLATVNAGAAFFAGTDMLGTVRNRSNGSGAQIETDFSWPFGEFRNYGNSVSTIHFTGQLEDTETGLDYFHARYYNSNLGRFLTPDPAGAAAAIASYPQTLNRYGYVAGMPLNYVDPLGQILCVSQAGLTTVMDDDDSCTNSGGWILNQTQTITVNGNDTTLDPEQSPLTGWLLGPILPDGGSGAAGGGAPTNSGSRAAPGNAPTVSHCLGVAAADKGVSIGLDILGSIPAVGNAVLGAAGIVRAGIAVNHAITAPVFAIGSGVYGAYGAATAGPEEATDSLVGAGSAGAGIGLTLAEGALQTGKVIPGIGNFISAGTGIWDTYQALKEYQSCMAGH